MQYRTSRLPSLFVFCAILLLSAPRSEGWQIPKVAAANLTPTLSVSPNPVTARAGQTVTFTAALQPAFRDAAFWFDWGDGTPASNASLNANVSHVFAQAGTFQVVAHARFSKRIINSAPIQVSVRRSLAGDMVVAGTRKVSPAAEIAQTTTTTPTSLVVRANNLAPSVNEPLVP